jgi:hypothetical protein
MPFSYAVTSGWTGFRTGRRGSEGAAADVFSGGANPRSARMRAIPTKMRVHGSNTTAAYFSTMLTVISIRSFGRSFDPRGALTI